jgi:small-conductance mechanosensitive channel
MSTNSETAGFTPPAARPLGKERRSVALAELLTTVALALATLVVVTVVSAGIARASVADGVIGNEGNLFAIALLLGVIFIGFGGLSVFAGNRPKKH